MKVYFLSSSPCALTLGGVYYGLVDGFERFIEVSPKDNLFACFTPEHGLPVGFFLNENLRFSPPDFCEVYLLKDGIAVYVKEFPAADVTFRVLKQAKSEGAVATLFRQGRLQLSLETEQGLFLFPLSPLYQDAEIRFLNGLCLLEGKGILAVFSRTGKRLFEEKILHYSLENQELNATMPLSDSKKRVAEGAWTVQGDSLLQRSFSIRQSSPQKSEGEILEELLPYAFFENVLLGGDFAAMLHESILEKADHLKEYLGDFLSVTITKDPTVCGLVKKEKDRLFYLDYFAVEIKNGKISDIRAV